MARLCPMSKVVNPHVAELVVHDEPEPCPYLEGETARLPLRQPLGPLSPAAFDEALAQGDRRTGTLLYRPSCPSCHACESLRIPAAELRMTRSQRRVWKKNQDLRVEVGPATFSEEKLRLMNRHKLERGLSREGRPMSARAYAAWFLRSCARTLEMRYLLDGALLGVGIVDVGARDSSSVYFYFDPDHSDRSLGTFSVLWECAWLVRHGGRHHYLGLYAERSPHIAYKARYFPHERLIGGEWRRFEDPPDGAAG